ncbi:MAG: TonB family protein [Steroidobacteraceae bacterium]
MLNPASIVRSGIARHAVASVSDRLASMVFLATLLHGMLIVGVTFSSAGDRGQSAPGLEVLLVTSELPAVPENDSAEYLAQRSQLGSGTAAEESRAQIHAPAAPAGGARRSSDARPGEAADVAGSAEQVLATQGQSGDVLYLANISAGSAASAADAAMLDGESSQTRPSDEPDEIALRGERQDELWITPNTRESALAPYLDGWRQRMEQLGTVNFPAIARNAQATTNPVLEVAINADGSLREAKVQKSSGSSELDAAALAILRLGNPFAAFPPDLRERYASLRFAYEWRFEAGGARRGTVRANPDQPADPETD